MKKIITLIITVLLLTSCVCITASATSSECYFCSSEPCECYEQYEEAQFMPSDSLITFSEDYTQIKLHKFTYSRFHSWYLSTEPEYKVPNEVKLTAKQESELLKYSIATNSNGKFLWVYLYMNDGTFLSATYIRDDISEEYSALCNRINNPTFSIDFLYPEGNVITTDKYELWGEEQIVTFYYDYDETFSVVSYSKDKSFSVYQGELILYKENFYFVDCLENNFNTEVEFPYEKKLKAYKITNEKLLESLNENMEKYYNDDYGIFLNDKFSKEVADVFIVVVFAILPLAALIVFAIIAIRSKGMYRKMAIITSSISAAELIIFAIIAAIVS